MRKVLKWMFGGLVIFILVGWAIESTKTPEQRAADLKERQDAQRRRAEEKREQGRLELASLPAYTAAQLARAYEANTVSADAVFKGKKFKVTGTVADINTDLFGRPYLTLRGGVNQFMEPQFQFDEGSSAQLGALRKGVQVQIICIGKGDIAKTPMSGDCIMP